MKPFFEQYLSVEPGFYALVGLWACVASVATFFVSKSRLRSQRLSGYSIWIMATGLFVATTGVLFAALGRGVSRNLDLVHNLLLGFIVVGVLFVSALISRISVKLEDSQREASEQESKDFLEGSNYWLNWPASMFSDQEKGLYTAERQARSKSD